MCQRAVFGPGIFLRHLHQGHPVVVGFFVVHADPLMWTAIYHIETRPSTVFFFLTGWPWGVKLALAGGSLEPTPAGAVSQFKPLPTLHGVVLLARPPPGGGATRAGG